MVVFFFSDGFLGFFNKYCIGGKFIVFWCDGNCLWVWIGESDGWFWFNECIKVSKEISNKWKRLEN